MATKTKPETNGGALLSLAEIEKVAQDHSLQALSTRGRFERAIVLSEGLCALRESVRPLMHKIMPLMNSPLGFLTDRGPHASKPEMKTPYDSDTVAECLIEGVLRGVYPVDNQFNIISARCYLTKNGFRHLLRSHPGVTDLKLSLGVPSLKNGGVVIHGEASWRVDGKGDALAADIPIRSNQGSGADQLLGKAERKLLARVYAQITGSDHTDLDGDVSDDTPRLSRTEALAGKLSAREPVDVPTAEQTQRLNDLAASLGLTDDGVREKCGQLEIHPDRLTVEAAARLITALEVEQASRAATE